MTDSSPAFSESVFPAYGDSMLSELDFEKLLEMQTEVSRMPVGEVGLDWIEAVGYGYAETDEEYIEDIRELGNELKKALGADVVRWIIEGLPDYSVIVGDVLVHVDVVPDGTGGYDVIAYPVYRFRDRREAEEWLRKIPPTMGYQV